jgi:cyclopropane-fatty-acyl-phospholipid synthase
VRARPTSAAWTASTTRWCRSAASSTPGATARRADPRARALAQAGGLGLIHFIGHVGHFETDYFIRKYVFPAAGSRASPTSIVEMEKAGLEVLDIENLRRHYALTLDAWAERFDRNWDKIRAHRPAALRRALPPHLARLPLRLRRDVPLRRRAHAPFPGRVLQGQRRAASYPMTRSFLYERRAPAQQEKRSASRAA